MLRLIWWLARLLAVVLILGIGFTFGGPYLLTAVGRYLVMEHPLAKADLVLVLSGQTLLRVPEGARIYHEGFAPKILLTSEPLPRGTEDLLKQGIRFPDSQGMAITILEALRVPRSAVLTLRERTNSTRAEMQAVAVFLKGHPVHSMIIVTSKSHTTRAHKIFSRGLGRGIRLIMRPVPGDPFDPARWWRDRQDAKDVLHEYQALLDFWRLGLWDAMTGWFAASPPAAVVRSDHEGFLNAHGSS
jgi:uncharacterized SAM-binding protein YcdF (DUF218 family)